LLSMEAQLDSLEADMEEFGQILEGAKRPRVREELQRLIGKTEAEILVAKAAAGTPALSEVAKTPAVSESPAPKPASRPKLENRPVDIPAATGPWSEITTFALDLGGYGKSTVTVDIRMKGVETLPTENITCAFTESSFDLKVVGHEGRNHRMVKSPLDKDVIPSSCNMRVKKNHIIITLEKVKGEHGYDSWPDLCAKGGRRKPPPKKGDNPQDSIMGMMKDLYDDGDDNMKKMIGEAMYKAQRGEKYDPKDSKLSGLDDMDDT